MIEAAVLAKTGEAAVLAKTGEAAKAGPIGLAVILLLCIACYFLFKSMSKHMKIVREEFPTEDGPAPVRKPAATTDLQRAEILKTDAVRTELPSAEDDEQSARPDA